MRERIEDIGRLLVMTEALVDHELFTLITCRDKDFIDVFGEMKEDKKDDLLHSLAYSISSVRDQLYEMVSICRGTDLLNSSDY